MMRIATWNVERLKHYKDMERLLSEIEKIGADILVLTETDERLHPDYPYCYKTPLLQEIRPEYYKSTENRVSIYTKYKCVREYPTYDRYTAICVELETEYGNLLVYGTIMGILGNRDKTFLSDLKKQMEDITGLSKEGKRICILGDYNLTFGDNYYYTKAGREAVQKCFDENGVFLLTGHRSECIDHIAVSDGFMHDEKLSVVSVDEWNIDRSLSDHKGTVVEISPKDPVLGGVDQDVFFEGTGFERHEFEYMAHGRLVCYKGPDGAYYRVDHLSGFYVMEDAENEDDARKGIFEDTDTFPDYLPPGERVLWVHRWLRKYAVED